MGDVGANDRAASVFTRLHAQLAAAASRARQSTLSDWFIRYLHFADGPAGRTQPSLHAARTSN